MSIWKYSETSNDVDSFWNKKKCPFCKIDLKLLFEGKESEYLETNFQFCQKCGWWKIIERAKSVYETDEIRMIKGIVEVSSAVASLKELDLTDIKNPLNEIRNYLVVKYEKRFNVNPRVFENVVCSVFRDLGYNAITTAYSGDGGIDVILQRDKEIIGVQVKCTKNKIQVEQIRSLAGALVLGDMTSGIFLTTSEFTRGGLQTTEKYNSKGFKIRLLDAEKFYKDLEFTQRELYKSKNEILSLIPTDFELKTVDKEIISDFL